jgi:hypothetical protein
MLAASQEGLLFLTLIVIHCNDFDSHDGGIFKAATELPVLMKVYIILCHERSNINVMVVLQSCTDSLHDLPGSFCETFPVSSDGTYDISNVKVEEDIDIKEEENVKAEKGTDNEEEECIDIKDEEGIYSEEGEEEDIDTKEEEDVNIKEEVSCEGTL